MTYSNYNCILSSSLKNGYSCIKFVDKIFKKVKESKDFSTCCSISSFNNCEIHNKELCDNNNHVVTNFIVDTQNNDELSEYLQCKACVSDIKFSCVLRDFFQYFMFSMYENYRSEYFGNNFIFLDLLMAPLKYKLSICNSSSKTLYKFNVNDFHDHYVSVTDPSCIFNRNSSISTTDIRIKNKDFFLKLLNRKCLHVKDNCECVCTSYRDKKLVLEIFFPNMGNYPYFFSLLPYFNQELGYFVDGKECVVSKKDFIRALNDWKSWCLQSKYPADCAQYFGNRYFLSVNKILSILNPDVVIFSGVCNGAIIATEIFSCIGNDRKDLLFLDDIYGNKIAREFYLICCMMPKASLDFVKRFAIAFHNILNVCKNTLAFNILSDHDNVLLKGNFSLMTRFNKFPEYYDLVNILQYHHCNDDVVRKDISSIMPLAHHNICLSDYKLCALPNVESLPFQYLHKLQDYYSKDKSEKIILKRYTGCFSLFIPSKLLCNFMSKFVYKIMFKQFEVCRKFYIHYVCKITSNFENN